MPAKLSYGRNINTFIRHMTENETIVKVQRAENRREVNKIAHITLYIMSCVSDKSLADCKMNDDVGVHVLVSCHCSRTSMIFKLLQMSFLKLC